MPLVSVPVLIGAEVDVSLAAALDPCKKLVLEEVELVAPLAERYRLLARQGIERADCLPDKLARLLDVEDGVLVGNLTRRIDEAVEPVKDSVNLPHEARHVIRQTVEGRKRI